MQKVHRIHGPNDTSWSSQTLLDFLERSSVEGKLLAYAYIHEGLTCEVHPFHPTHLHRILLWTHPFDNSPQHALFPWNCWSRSPLFLRTTCLYIFSSFLYFSAINRLSRLKKAVLINIKTNLVIYKQEREGEKEKKKCLVWLRFGASCPRPARTCRRLQLRATIWIWGGVLVISSPDKVRTREKLFRARFVGVQALAPSLRLLCACCSWIDLHRASWS